MTDLIRIGLALVVLKIGLALHQRRAVENVDYGEN